MFNINSLKGRFADQWTTPKAKEQQRDAVGIASHAYVGADSLEKLYPTFKETVEHVKIFKKITSFLKHALNAIRWAKPNSAVSSKSWTQPLLGHANILPTLVLTPLNIQAFGHHAGKFGSRLIDGEFTKSAKSGLKVLSDIGSLSSDAASGITIASQFGKASLGALACVTPLMSTAGIMSGAMIALHAKGLWNTYCFSKSLRGRTTEHQINLLNVMDPKKLKKHLRVDGKKIQERLDNIKNKEKVIQDIETRIKYRKITQTLLITSATIALVASIILLASPAAPAAFALLALSGTVGLIAYIINRQASKRLMSAMEDTTTWGPIPGTSAGEQGQDRITLVPDFLSRRRREQADATTVSFLPRKPASATQQ